MALLWDGSAGASWLLRRRNRTSVANMLGRAVLAAGVAIVTAAGTAAAGENVLRDITAAATPVPAYTAAGSVQQVRKAALVAADMGAAPGMAGLLRHAKGVLVVPVQDCDGTRSIPGVREGVLLVQHKGSWSGPVFYNIGRPSVGLPAGSDAGALAMLLMTSEALDRFMGAGGLPVDAVGGLAVARHDRRPRWNAGGKDIVLWAESGEAYADALTGMTDVRLDEKDIRAFFGRPATAAEIASGTVQVPGAEALIGAMPAARQAAYVEPVPIRPADPGRRRNGRPACDALARRTHTELNPNLIFAAYSGVMAVLPAAVDRQQARLADSRGKGGHPENVRRVSENGLRAAGRRRTDIWRPEGRWPREAQRTRSAEPAAAAAFHHF